MDPCLDVGEVVACGEDCLALVLLVQLAVGVAVGGERSGVDEADWGKELFAVDD